MERAFGPVITAKLKDTCEGIKASFLTGLTDHKEYLEEILNEKMDTKFENQDKKMDTKFENLDEKIEGYIGNLVQQFGQLLEVKLQEQKEDFNQKLEQQKLEIMELMHEKFTSMSFNYILLPSC